MPEPVDLEPDELVADLVDRAGDAPDLIQLVGFIGEAHGEGAEDRLRIYADKELVRWIEVDRTAVHRRERIPEEDRDTHAPMSVVWVETDHLRNTRFESRPARLPMEFLNDRAELYFEPPANLYEAVAYMKMSPSYLAFGLGCTTRRTRYPVYHC